MIQYVQKMIQHLHIGIAEDDPAEMYDDVPKLPMTYRDSPVNCIVVVAVAIVVEYLPS